MLKLPAEREGDVIRDGVRIHWQVHGHGPRSLLLLPTWAIVHSDFWRNQVPHFAERYTVVSFDGRGNGASGRPSSAAAYSDDAIAGDALAVLDATGVPNAVAFSVSAGAGWGLRLASESRTRIAASVFIAPSLPLSPPLPERAQSAASFDQKLHLYDGWFKFNRHYWMSDYRDFLEFFFLKCFTEPDSANHVAHFVGMGLETTPETLLLTVQAPSVVTAACERLARGIATPALVLQGDADAITPPDRGRILARLV